MKKSLLLILLCLNIISAVAQTNYLADTAFTTDVGYNGDAASCIYTGGGWDGFPITNTQGLSVADFITVPSGATWTFDTVVIYAYEIGSSDISPFTAGYLQIYADGPPGLGGVSIWGDTITNVLISTGFANIYRVGSQDLTSNQRPIMYLKLHLSPAPHLSAGTYWLHWSAKPSDNGPVYSPPKVLPGRINPSGQNGRQDSTGSWTTINDNGRNDGFDKMVIGSAAVTAVPELSNKPTASLNQNVPNPFNSTTNISFSIKQAGYVRLCVFDITGQLVSALVNQYMEAGNHQVIFDAKSLSQGIYIYQLNSDNCIKSMSMMLN